MWRDYAKGERTFCGISLLEGLREHQKLDHLLITSTTKGVLKGIPGIPEEDDTNITRRQLEHHYAAFGFKTPEDIARYEALLSQGFHLISRELEKLGHIFVDTKFECGYAPDEQGQPRLISIDEIGTPDSSRFWDATAYAQGTVVEHSKEGFRKFLLKKTDEKILLDKTRMPERKHLAATYLVPVDEFYSVSATYKTLAEHITGTPAATIENAQEEILDALNRYKLVE